MRKQTHLLVKIRPLVLFVLITGFVCIFKIVFVAGQSMEPTLRNHQIMLVYKLADVYEEDDIIVFNTKQNGVCVKRVIAEKDDFIQLKDGKVFRNKVELSGYSCRENVEMEYILNEDEYFVIGDNIEASIDSRDFGCIKKQDIIGKVIAY